MRFAVATEPGEAWVRQTGLATGRWFGDSQSGGAAAELATSEVVEGRPTGPGSGGREAPLHHGDVEVDDVDQRSADVRRDRADPHSSQRLAQSELEGIEQG